MKAFKQGVVVARMTEAGVKLLIIWYGATVYTGHRKSRNVKNVN